MKPTRIPNKNMATDSRKGKPELSSGNGSSFTPNKSKGSCKFSRLLKVYIKGKQTQT